MYYVATSTAVDGRGKILVGQQAITLFDTIALKGFLGHEMAHLVTDNAARGCNDYILRDPQMEADADALAARAIGTRPVKAFLKQVLALTDGENWDAKRRLKLLRTFQSSIARSTEQRFSDLGKYDVKRETKVYFATGDYTITAEAKQVLAALAKEALESAGPKAYLIQVSGFADAVGSAATNEVLSKRRSEAVVAYLLQECAIPVGRIVSPGALGETNPAASNESASGRAENRRVDVKLLINKGIAGGS